MLTSVSARHFAALPAHTTLTMPSLSPTMEQGNIASWTVKVGDTIKPGDVLAEVETDKATMAWENQDDGVVAKLLVESGARDIAVGQPVAVIVDDAADVSAFENYKGGSNGGGSSNNDSAAKAGSGQKAAEPTTSTSSTKTLEAGPKPQQANFRMGPAARLLLGTHGLAASDVTATGPHAIITKYDVLVAVQAGVKSGQVKKEQQPQAEQPAAVAQIGAAPATSLPQLQPQPLQPQPQQLAEVTPTTKQAALTAPPPGSYTDIPNGQIRKVIASRLVASKVSTPALYVSACADLGPLAALRAELTARGTKVSVNDCVVKAVALALREVSAANSYWDEKVQEAVLFKSIDISVAVATDRGLLTPIVKDADKKTLPEISASIKSLAKRAKEGKLKPDEFQGGSFTVSNLGMFNVHNFSAIINPPQACILAVGGAAERVALGPNGQPVAHSVMNVTISADHRVYDGQLAADFLSAFVRNMESPINLLM